MTTDPYRPPAANLEVPKPPPPPAPWSIKAAVGLIYGSLALMIVLTIVTNVGLLPKASPGSPWFLDALTVLFSVLLFGFFAYKIRAGRNWARWVVSVWWTLGIIGFAITYTFVPQVWKSVPWTAWAGALVQTVIQLASIVLLFVGPSARWFRAQ